MQLSTNNKVATQLYTHVAIHFTIVRELRFIAYMFTVINVMAGLGAANM